MKLHELVDTFDGTPNPLLHLEGPATIADGHLSLPLVSNVYPSVPAAVFTDEPTWEGGGLDLTGSSLTFEIVSMPVTARSKFRVNIASPDDPMRGETLGWTITAGVIEAHRFVDNIEATGWSAPFDPDSHRWLKIEHAPGAVTWSTSGDGLEWNDRTQLATSMVTDQMVLAIATELLAGAGATPAPALLDNLNNPPEPMLDDPPTTIASDPYAPNLAIDLYVAEVEGAFILDEHELDGYAVLGWGDNPAGWVNVVCDVTHAQIARGTTGDLGPTSPAEAGTCSVVVRDIERRIDPTINGDVIRPGTPVRVRAWVEAWSVVLFTGVVSADGIAVVYSRTDPPIVTFTASDLIGEMSRWESVGEDPPVGAGDSLLGRVSRVLADMGVSGGIALSPDLTYAASLAATKLDRAWPAVTDAALAELGRVWVTAGNRVAVRARGAQLTGPVRGTLSDWHGETAGDSGGVHCCYADPSIRYSPESLVNRAIGGRASSSGVTAAPPVQLDDEVSQARHGVHVVRETALALADDAQVDPWVRSIIGSNTEQRVRVERVSPMPSNAPEAWQAVCLTDIGDRWFFRVHPQLGPTVRQGLGVLGIEHDITPDGWLTVWHTAWAPEPGENPSGWFMLDISTLEGGDVLAPFA